MALLWRFLWISLFLLGSAKPSRSFGSLSMAEKCDGRSRQEMTPHEACTLSREQLLSMRLEDAFLILLEMYDSQCGVSAQRYADEMVGTIVQDSSKSLGPRHDGVRLEADDIFLDHAGVERNHNETCVEELQGDQMYGSASLSTKDMKQVDQRSELMALFAALDGISWVKKTNWGTSSSICTWYGVTCKRGCDSASIQGNKCPVVVLSLLGNNLRGQIPAINLPDLNIVDLSYNQITGIEPGLSLPVLTMLRVTYNSFKVLTSEIDLPMLYYLDIAKNLLADFPPDISLPSLEEMDLSGNQLQGTIPTLNYPGLLSLDLSSNYLWGTISKIEHPSLLRLYLSFNYFSGWMSKS